jgi:DNA-binding XRE family transcriptional regulator
MVAKRRVRQIKEEKEVQKEHDYDNSKAQSYQEWRDSLLANPRFRAVYEEEAAKRKKELWLQLVEARRSAGLTQGELAQRMGVSQAEVARLEKLGYEGYNISTLRRYVRALGKEIEFSIV